MPDSNEREGRNNSGSFRIAGMVIPWPIIVFVVSVIANAAVAHYRIGELEEILKEHKQQIRELERAVWTFE